MHDYSKISKPSGEKKLRFREWLIKKLDNKEISGVEWLDRRQGLFVIPWKHASRHGWSLSSDAEIFKQWAIHSGRYKPGVDKPDPAKWKTNFRCTLNALQHFKEIRDRSCPRGPRACKIYKIQSSKLPEEERKKVDTEQTEPLNLTDREIIKMLDEMRESGHSTQKPLTRRPNSAFPAFEAMVVERDRFPCPRSFWYVEAWNALAVDQYVEGNDEEKSTGEPTEETVVSSSREAVEKEEDEVPSDQEIIDLVDQMSEQSNSSFEDLDGIDGPNDGGGPGGSEWTELKNQ